MYAYSPTIASIKDQIEQNKNDFINIERVFKEALNPVWNAFINLVGKDFSFLSHLSYLFIYLSPVPCNSSQRMATAQEFSLIPVLTFFPRML